MTRKAYAVCEQAEESEGSFMHKLGCWLFRTRLMDRQRLGCPVPVPAVRTGSGPALFNNKQPVAPAAAVSARG